MAEQKTSSYSNETFERLNYLAHEFVQLFNHPKSFLNNQDYSIFKIKDSFYKIAASTPISQSKSNDFGISIFPHIKLDNSLKIIERSDQMIYYFGGFKNNDDYHVDEIGKYEKDQNNFYDLYFRETIETTGGFGLIKELELMLNKIQRSIEF